MNDRHHRAVSCLLALLLLTGSGFASAEEPDSVEQRLTALEQRWEQMQAQLAEIRALLAPSEQAAAKVTADMDQTMQGLRGDLTTLETEVHRQSDAINAESAARRRAISISTYGQINASQRDPGGSLIDAESFELVFSGQPHERISFFSELEFERAASVGAERGGEVLVEQAYVDYALSDAWSMRAGVILVPFGNNEADHYAPLRDVVARPLSSRLIAPSDWTDNGFGVVGQRMLSDDWTLDWEAYVIAGLGGEPERLGLRDFRQGFGADNNQNKAVTGHLALRNNNALSVGLGLYQGAYDERGERPLRGLGLDFNWYPAPWKLSGEYLLMLGERADGSTARLHGGYIRTGYDLEQHLPEQWAGPGFPEAKLSLVYEYDDVRLDDLSLASLARQRERKHVLGLRFQPDRSWILKLNREWSQASEAILVNGDGGIWQLGVGFVF